MGNFTHFTFIRPSYLVNCLRQLKVNVSWPSFTIRTELGRDQNYFALHQLKFISLIFFGSFYHLHTSFARYIHVDSNLISNLLKTFRADLYHIKAAEQTVNKRHGREIWFFRTKQPNQLAFYTEQMWTEQSCSAKRLPSFIAFNFTISCYSTRFGCDLLLSRIFAFFPPVFILIALFANRYQQIASIGIESGISGIEVEPGNWNCPIRTKGISIIRQPVVENPNDIHFLTGSLVRFLVLSPFYFRLGSLVLEQVQW